MNPVGVAVIGAGPWGSTLARTFARLPEVDLRWICDLDPARRAKAAVAHPETPVTAALDDVLADSGVEAAIVAVDSPRHHSVGLRVLSADRHLLVEKPMALSVVDAAALRDAAEARARVLTVGHLLLHHASVRRARQLVAGGALGEALYLEAARTAPGTAHRGGSAWWTLAPHDISLALYLFDAVPTKVSAIGTRHGEGDLDVAAFATLTFSDGRLAHIHAARFAAAKRRGFSIVGTEQSLTFDELARENPLRLDAHPSPPGVPSPLGSRSPDGSVDSPLDLSVASDDPLLAQCRHFVSCVERGDPSGGNSAHALAVVRVLEAGERSMREGGAPIEIE